MKRFFTAIICILFIFIFQQNIFADIESNSNTYSYDANMFSIVLPENIQLTTETDNPNTILLKDLSGSFNASFSSDKIDTETISAMQVYLNNTITDEHELFNNIAKYKAEYIKLLEEQYNNDFIYNIDENTNKTYIKTFYSDKEQIYDVDSYITMYNIFNYNYPKSSEKSIISVLIPVYENKSIYSLNVFLEKGQLSDETIKMIRDIIGGISIKNTTSISQDINVLNDSSITQKMNEGVFPDIKATNFYYNLFYNKKAGYSYKFPNTFIPFKNSNMISDINTQSYIINPTTFLSIEYVKSNNMLVNKINQTITSSKNKILVNDCGTINETDFNIIYIKTTQKENQVNKYVLTYIVYNNTSIYTFELASQTTPYSNGIEEEILKIVKTLKIEDSSQSYLVKNNYQLKYFNSDLYKFVYPGNLVIKNISNGNSGSDFVINSPDVPSSALKIEVYEESAYKTFENDNNEALKTFDAQQTNINPISSAFVDDSVAPSYIQLYNYIDDYNRIKYCYIKSYLKNNTIYNMKITVSDYLISENNPYKDDFLFIFNIITSSFTI